MPDRVQKKLEKFDFALLTTRKYRIEYGSCGEQACRLEYSLFTRFVGERKFFDKLTVKPMSSESAVVAVGDAPRGGNPISSSALSVRKRAPKHLRVFGIPTRVLSLRRVRLTADSPNQTEGFDPGSERTLAAWLRHASRTDQ